MWKTSQPQIAYWLVDENAVHGCLANVNPCGNYPYPGDSHNFQ